MNNEIVTDNVVDITVDGEVSNVKADIPITKVSRMMKDALLRWETNGFDVNDALEQAGYSTKNLRVARKRFLEHPYVHRHINLIFSKDKAYARSVIVTGLKENLDIYKEKAKSNSYDAAVYIKLGQRLSEMMKLEDGKDDKPVTLDQLIMDAKDKDTKEA